jgi:hydrophobic/amphiphilic exporter-1 (mainly G- bacteria), HAE1 family
MILSISTTFIKRPVLTTVCTLIILLLGAICIPLLPLNYLPELAPTTIQVTSNYIGADAEKVETTVTTLLERQINGVEGMQYMTSSSSDDGSSSISVFFGPERKKEQAQVDVQNRVSQVESQLPEQVRQTGVTTEAASNSILQAYAFYSEKGEYDSTFLSNYVDLNVVDVVKRVPGVGRATIVGERKYAMRLWLDPNALASRGLTASDVSDAIEEQNIQVGLGAIGQQPSTDDQRFEFTLRTPSQLRDAQEFNNLVVKTGKDGTLIKIKDVGRAELGAQSYSSSVLAQGQAGVGLVIYQLPGSNALDVATGVRDALVELRKDFPPGMKAEEVFNTTEFVQASLDEVVKTLLESVFLVVAVIFVFLQDWRATVIPLVAMPVSLLGSLAFMLAFGFSINNLSMFGLILATGLVVDDAIVVVEAIAVKLEQGMKPLQASLEAMEELTGAVIATSLVLMAVFIPVAFFPGTTGRIYQQFALTIVFSIAISTFNALSFSPAVSALILRRHQETKGVFGVFFRYFNRCLNWVIDRYRGAVSFLIKFRVFVIGLFIAGVVATVLVYQSVPTGFLPEEDQGVFLGIIQAPDGVSLKYTNEVASQMDGIFKEYPEIKSRFIVTGQGFDGNSSSKGFFYCTLNSWDKREKTVDDLLEEVNGAFQQKIGNANVIAFNLPAILGLSQFGGFEFQMQDRSGGKFSIEQLVANAGEVIAKASKDPSLTGVFTQYTANAPRIELDLDRDKLQALNVDFEDALNALGAYFGSEYVNDFVFGQRTYRVYIQADREFRNSPEDINQIYVRSRNNNVISLGELVTQTPKTGAQIINHYNVYRAVKIQGGPAPGYSSGQAIASMDKAFSETVQSGFGREWTGTAKEELAAGGLSFIIFGLGLIAVFLVLAAQYESYVDPIIIMLSVPLAILGAMIAVKMRGLINDAYCQIALVMLVGLASKNAILIVEFANLAKEQGMSIAKAALTAATERFRPIVMTAGSGLAGFWPLVAAHGAGSASRWSLGTTVFGGLLVATFLSLLIVPVIYVVIKNLEAFVFKGKGPKPPTPPSKYKSDSELLDEKEWSLEK